MRSFLAGLLVLSLAFSIAAAQRPWIRTATPNVGSPPRLEIAANSLVAFRQGMSTSVDQGENWSAQGAVPQPVLGVTDFFSNVSISASQLSKGDSVDIYFTQGGTSWSFSERLDVGMRSVVELEALGQTFYVVTAEGAIIARGISIKELTVPVSSGAEIVDLEVSEGLFGVLTSGGMFLSTDAGDTWTLNNPPASAYNLVFRNKDLLASTARGVMRFNVSSSTWETLGSWGELTQPPAIRAVAADAQRIIAFAATEDNRLQLYRLDAGDTAWIPTGYEAPLDKPLTGREMLVIDAGWAITYLESVEDADSNGVYRYNLNDFTGVKEDLLLADVSVRLFESGLEIYHEFVEGGSLELYDVMGRQLLTATLGASPFRATLPDNIRGIVAVAIRGADGSTARTVVLR